MENRLILEVEYLDSVLARVEATTHYRYAVVYRDCTSERLGWGVMSWHEDEDLAKEAASKLRPDIVDVNEPKWARDRYYVMPTTIVDEAVMQYRSFIVYSEFRADDIIEALKLLDIESFRRRFNPSRSEFVVVVTSDVDANNLKIIEGLSGKKLEKQKFTLGAVLKRWGENSEQAC